jgi:hypothetical protein
MAKQITTAVTINADLKKVWEVLTDFDAYPDWNPFIKSIRGEVAEEKTIVAKIDKMTFKPRVLVFEKEKEFKWLGHLLFKGLFDGEHRFRLSENEDGTVAFEQSEKFTGILVPLFNKMLEKDTKPGFEAMNRAFKARCEESKRDLL